MTSIGYRVSHFETNTNQKSTFGDQLAKANFKLKHISKLNHDPHNAGQLLLFITVIYDNNQITSPIPVHNGRNYKLKLDNIRTGLWAPPFYVTEE